jgi:hypothetical protein
MVGWAIIPPPAGQWLKDIANCAGPKASAVGQQELQSGPCPRAPDMATRMRWPVRKSTDVGWRAKVIRLTSPWTSGLASELMKVCDPRGQSFNLKFILH